MKPLNKIYKNIVTLSIILLVSLSILPAKSEAPTHFFKQVILPRDYVKKINNTYWISYSVTNSIHRRIGLSIEPPFYFKNMTITKTLRPNLYGEIELKGTLMYKSTDSMDITCWVNILSNQDAILFLKTENKTGEIVPFTYRISYEDEKSQSWKSSEIFPIRYASDNLDPTSNQMIIEKTSNPYTKGEPYFFQTLRYDEIIHQFFKGPLFTYRNLQNGLQERIDSLCSSEILNHSGITSFENKAQIEDQSFLEDWIFFSNNHLVTINSSLTKKIIQTLDFYKSKRFSRDGFYYKCVNDGYLGENDSTYYWDYSMYGARSILEYYYKGDQTLFYDIAILSYLSLSRNRNPSGYWSNNTVSTWLLSDYKISNTYFDTRFNVDAGIFLLEVYEKFKIPYALSMAEKIGNILQVMMQNGKAYPTQNHGLLIQDYDVSYASTIRTHTSLNHLLNESSFFMLLFKTTRKEQYLRSSDQVMLGIMATEEKWKDEGSGDLFYCLFPNGLYGKKDYLTLTYHDLIRMKRLLKDILGFSNPTIERLGSFKENHLIKLGVVKNKKFLADKGFK